MKSRIPDAHTLRMDFFSKVGVLGAANKAAGCKELENSVSFQLMLSNCETLTCIIEAVPL